MNVRAALDAISPKIQKSDAELLLACILNIGRATLRAFPELELTIAQKQKFNDMLNRRAQGEPIAYLLGHKEFWSLDFIVSPDVLIPRADTELLVEMALELIEPHSSKLVLDLGTGCGAVGLAIAEARPTITVVATDKSSEALQIAKLNAKHLHICNVEFALGNWFDAISASGIPIELFDIIVSNPPYVASFDPHLEQGDLRFEPNMALVAGDEGMNDLHIIISQARAYLKSGGQLLVEHGYNQEQLVAKEFAQAGFQNVICYNDLSGIPRVTLGNNP